MKCAPKFKRDTSSGIPNHLAPGTTYIYLDPALGTNLSNAIQQAILDWNAANPSDTLATSPTPCSGGHCINTQIGSIPPNSCAASQYTQLNGIITGSMMTFPSAAQSWNANFNRRLVNHELEHHFGMDEYNGCASSNSLMAPTSCNATSGFPLTPGPTDSLPVTRSVYGNNPTTSCPQ